jgi:lipopolysaccharide biosynthesis regulator YciM
MDEAKELYQQAANCYKLGKNWDAAVTCLQKCVDCTPEGEDRELGGIYHEMANNIKNVSTNKFLEYSRIAIDKYSLSARLG